MIRMVGTDHNLAPINVRQVFSFRKQEMIDAMEKIKESINASGVLLLATCNRMELWADTEDKNASLLAELCRVKGVEEGEFGKYFRSRDEEEAIRHLFFLSCGLKSAIVAEDQILGQVKDALSFARLNYCTDNVLEVLFRTAISAAKKVKTDVSFTHANATAIGQAIQLLKEKGFDLHGKRCMVIGNGEYGRLAAETLMRAGADVTVTVRQYHSGIVMIPDGCKQIHYGEKMEYFPKCDLVVSATTSPNYTLFFDKVEPCRPDHHIILIDFAVPRDIDPRIKELPEYEMYDIDDFKTAEIQENESSYKEASAIIDEKMQEFLTWSNYRDLIPHIKLISEEAATDLHGRLEKSIKDLPLQTEDREGLFNQINESSEKMVSKILFVLRDSLEEKQFRKCVAAIESAHIERM